jgi:hypothetical protein
MIVLLGFLVGWLMVGLLIAAVCIVIPAIISLKFCLFQSYDKAEVNYRSLKIGYLTFFKSLKVYFVVILKPLLLALLVGIIGYSFFLSSAINLASQTMPDLLTSLANQDTFIYVYEEMLAVEGVKNILTIGSIVSGVVGYLVYFSLKLKRDFIPFISFEMPITSERAVSINKKILKGNYLKFFINQFLILLMLLIPGGLAYLTYSLLSMNEVYSDLTLTLLTSIVFFVTAGPVVILKQLHYIYSYKNYSKPYQEDFEDELKNVIKEIEELQKMINKKDDK